MSIDMLLCSAMCLLLDTVCSWEEEVIIYIDRNIM